MENQILDYNKRFAQIQRGVDTDWMVLPLRNAFDQNNAPDIKHEQRKNKR